MTARHQRTQLRRVALIACLAWFSYWGHSAYVSANAHDRAEAAEFEAASRQDWASAHAHEQAREAATQDLIRSISWGFFIPLALLVAGEVNSGIRRARTSSTK